MKNKILILLILLYGTAKAQENSSPLEFIYKTIETDTLKAYVFLPKDISDKESRPSIAIFHGGGWAMGEPSWGFGYADKYAELGMVSISVEYRISNKENITPIDAMEDARDFFIWARENANRLNINKDSIAAFGWSAGGHLVAGAAVFPKYTSDSSISSKPNALILQSPAVSILNDEWFKQLLLERGKPIDYSPAQHIKKNMPPTIIVIGRDDSVTPLKNSELFRDEMIKNNNICELHVYDSVGHLFTPLPDNGWPKPDEEISKKAFIQIDLFLKGLGYIR
ncbi:acetyl esterase/lipase [Algoriphagus sp. 4150]|uniref:alpha/beta hydrolase n=1 Tax=Algoriphagus sp. 4150 TaxID=2817756 RepID=UPI002860761E|nr:alpha/beta hydrolase [Algoriphagus sp. 4150]MDR7127675.1 acetyl esterase/lipase [Algoriphagus sp. 4150]